MIGGKSMNPAAFDLGCLSSRECMIGVGCIPLQPDGLEQRAERQAQAQGDDSSPLIPDERAEKLERWLSMGCEVCVVVALQNKQALSMHRVNFAAL